MGVCVRERERGREGPRGGREREYTRGKERVSERQTDRD